MTDDPVAPQTNAFGEFMKTGFGYVLAVVAILALGGYIAVSKGLFKRKAVAVSEEPVDETPVETEEAPVAEEAPVETVATEESNKTEE